jgi:hypothetical protein
MLRARDIKAVAMVTAVALFGLCTTMPSYSQSTDFSRPTPLTTVPLVGEFDGSQDVSYFYTFEAGPGNILVTYDAHASRYSTNTQLRLYDANRNDIGQVNLTAATRPSSETKRFNLGKRQRVVLETVLHQDKDMGILKYSVNVSGAVQLVRPSAATPTSTTMPDYVAPRVAPGRSGSSLGRLHVEMRDGSTHDFDMGNVRKITVE